MIGVVVWSSGSREKAIIWCEDHATLAYLQGFANLVDTRHWPQPGDLVELETRTVSNLRHAFNVSLLSEQSCPHLPQLLADAEPVAAPPHLRLVAVQDHPTDGAQTTLPRSAAPGLSYGQPRIGSLR